MIDYHTFCEIHRLLEQEHLSLAQIAAKLHLAYQTVEKWANRPTYQKPACKSKNRTCIIIILGYFHFSICLGI